MYLCLLWASCQPSHTDCWGIGETCWANRSLPSSQLTLMFGGDIQHTLHSIPAPPVVVGMATHSFLAGESSVNQSTCSPNLHLTRWQISPGHISRSHWWVSWNLRPSWSWDASFEYLPQLLWMLSVLLSDKCRGILRLAIRGHAALTSTVPQCVYNLWREQFKCTINPLMVTSRCILWGLSGRAIGIHFLMI